MRKYDKLISIIVPVYNVEIYLEKCLDSIINQTYDNLEIILINDGSTDLSGDICDKYARNDNRIRVIHKKNEGQSIARNIGLELAKGDLIGFIDSDDFIDLKMYESLYKSMKENDADIIECAVEKIYEDKVLREETGRIFSFSGNEALTIHLDPALSKIKPRAAVWSRLYDKKVVKDIRFPEGKIHEDYYYTYRALLNCEKYCWLDRCLYSHIYTNISSTTQQRFNKKDLAKIEMYKERMEYLNSINLKELSIYAEKNYYLLLLQYYYKSAFVGMDDEAIKIKEILSNSKVRIRSLKFNRKKTIEFAIMLNFPYVYLGLRKILK